MKAISIFNSIDDFNLYTDGLLADTTLEQLYPTMKSAIHDIEVIISPEMVGAIRTMVGSSALEKLKTAVASGTLKHYQIFATVKRNGADNSLYKYQHEEMKRHYADAFWQAMDELLLYLDQHGDQVKWDDGKKTFEDTYVYQNRQKLPIKSAGEFDEYFQIDRSAYFFSRIQYIMSPIWENDILPIIGKTDKENILRSAKRLLCYKVMAKAVSTFDITELPVSLRHSMNDEFTKDSAVQQRKALAAQIEKDAAHFESCLTSLMARGTANRSNVLDRNKESAKHFTLI